MPRPRDAVEAAVRESTRVASERRQFRDGVRATQVDGLQPPIIMVEDAGLRDLRRRRGREDHEGRVPGGLREIRKVLRRRLPPVELVRRLGGRHVSLS